VICGATQRCGKRKDAKEKKRKEKGWNVDYYNILYSSAM